MLDAFKYRVNKYENNLTLWLCVYYLSSPIKK